MSADTATLPAGAASILAQADALEWRWEKNPNRYASWYADLWACCCGEWRNVKLVGALAIRYGHIAEPGLGETAVTRLEATS